MEKNVIYRAKTKTKQELAEACTASLVRSLQAKSKSASFAHETAAKFFALTWAKRA